MSPSSVLQVLGAYFFVDLLTGLYHWATDKGLNHPHQVELFTLHHETNTMDGFDWQPSVIGLPAIALGLLIGSSFLIAAGAFGILSQVPHYYAHRRSSVPLVHHVVSILQIVGLILPPRHHAEHHKTFDRNFCILSGWNNWWLNQVVRLFAQ